MQSTLMRVTAAAIAACTLFGCAESSGTSDTAAPANRQLSGVSTAVVVEGQRKLPTSQSPLPAASDHMALLTHDWAAWTLLDDVVGALDLDQERNCSFVQLLEGRMFVAWPQGTEAKAAALRTEFGALIPDGAPVHLLGHPFSHEQWADRVQRPAPDPLTVGETEGFEIRAGRFRHCVEEADGVLVAARVRLGCPECTQPRPTKGWEVQESCTRPRC